jgi:hypothetical protein
LTLPPMTKVWPTRGEGCVAQLTSISHWAIIHRSAAAACWSQRARENDACQLHPLGLYPSGALDGGWPSARLWPHRRRAGRAHAICYAIYGDQRHAVYPILSQCDDRTPVSVAPCDTPRKARHPVAIDPTQKTSFRGIGVSRDYYRTVWSERSFRARIWRTHSSLSTLTSLALVPRLDCGATRG